MIKTVGRRHFLIASTLATTLAPALTRAANPQVQMLNAHPTDRRQRMVFLPRLLTVQPGDTVKFLAVDPGHNTATIAEMIPKQADGWVGGINEEIEVTLEQPGFYGYKCTPHYTIGMVGLIVVEGDGKLDNLQAARAVTHRGRARSVFEEIWAEADAEGLLS